MKTYSHFSELEAKIKQSNHKGLEDFDGLSPIQMHHILYSPFESTCIVQLNSMDEEDCSRVPILRLVRMLVDEVNPEMGLKLTAVGNIPPKIVKKIYDAAEFPDDAIDSGIVKIRNENDCAAVVTARGLSILCSMLKVRNKTMTRTKKCPAMLNDSNSLLRTLWEAFSTKFNVCCFDGYPENDCGTLAFAYMLWLLHKYGKQKKSEKFYAHLYLNAFPSLTELFPGRLRSREEEAAHCMAVRMFHRFFHYFGIICIENQYGMGDTQIQTTELFHKMIRIRDI